MSLKKTKGMDELFESFLSLKNVEECYAYFEDLCTMKELNDLCQRLEIVKILDVGNSYQQAATATGASSATISRVKRCLDYGTGGYRLVLDRMKETEK